MGVRNYLIEGVSCAGKTTVCRELQRRGLHAIHGDNELAYWGDPRTGEPLISSAFEHWIWDIEKVRALVSDRRHAATFLCGGSRNTSSFVDLLDAVFVLEIDRATLDRRLSLRPDDEWSGSPGVGISNARRQHAKKDYVPSNAILINAMVPVDQVVDAILEYVTRQRSPQQTD